MSTRPRLVAILPSPAPYTTPILNALAKQLDLSCIYLASENRLGRFTDTWGVDPEFEHSVWKAARLHLRSIDLHAEFKFGVPEHLRRLAPDAVLMVSWKPAALMPLGWSRWSGSAAVMWAESTRFSGLLRGRTSTGMRRAVVRSFDGFVSNGSAATAYLRDLGARPERIITSRLPAGYVAGPTDRRAAGGGIRFLFVGRLIAQKRPLELIAAFRGVHDALPHATLTVVGSGELESEVREAAKYTSGVEYIGRKEGNELSAVYARSDVLVLPALREVWGVVVNEALSHGLFVVASEQVGSAHDLLTPEAGIMLRTGELDRLAPVLVDVAKTIDASDAARAQRATNVADCTPERFAADIVHATTIATRVRRDRWRARRRPPRWG